ncbi:hypothetical protein D9M73_165750 [compost metagenome]
MVARTKARTRARKNRPANAASARPVSRNHVKALRLANSVRRSLLVPPLTAPRTSSWTTISITSATVSTTCRSRSPRKAVAVARVLRHKAPRRVRALHVPASHKVARTVPATAMAPAPALRQPSVTALAVAHRATARPVAKIRAIAVRPVTTSHVRNLPCRTRVARRRRSCTRSRKRIASRHLSSWINCQAVLVVRNQRC